MRKAAALPSNGRSAVVFVGVLSILLSLVNWGVSLIFSGLLIIIAIDHPFAGSVKVRPEPLVAVSEDFNESPHLKPPQLPQSP